MIEQGLYTYLSADAGITALVGSRIYALMLPQGVTYPAITYQRVSGPREYAMGGPAGVANPRFQIDIYSDTGYLAAKQVAGAVRSALSGYSGAMGGETAQTVILSDERDIFEDDTGLWRVSTDYTIWHDEA